MGGWPGPDETARVSGAAGRVFPSRGEAWRSLLSALDSLGARGTAARGRGPRGLQEGALPGSTSACTATEDSPGL